MTSSERSKDQCVRTGLPCCVRGSGMAEGELICKHVIQRGVSFGEENKWAMYGDDITSLLEHD